MLARTILILLSLCLGAAGQTATPAASKTPSSGSKTASNAAPAANPLAILHTAVGDMKCELFPEQAPLAVKNFIGLAKGTKTWKDGSGKQVTGKPLYDGVVIHRTIPGFMIQSGDPTGTGSGDVGFEFANEVHPDLLFDRPGRLAMANRSNPTSNGSQFFITEVPVAFLNGGYTIFGQCDDATVDLVKKIARLPCQGGQTCGNSNDRPQAPVKINHVEIVNAGTAAKPPAGKTSAKPKPSPTTH